MNNEAMNPEDLYCRVFVTDETRVGNKTYKADGTVVIDDTTEMFWVSAYGVLEEPLYMKKDEDYYVVKFEENGEEPIFYVGDYIYLRCLNWQRGGPDICKVYFKITSIFLKDDKPYKYILHREAGDRLTLDVDPGNVFMGLGQQTGEMYIDVWFEDEIH